MKMREMKNIELNKMSEKKILALASKKLKDRILFPKQIEEAKQLLQKLDLSIIK